MVRAVRINHHDLELIRKGRILALILLGMAIAVSVLIVVNTSSGNTAYNIVNLPLLLAVIVLYVLNRAGCVWIASISTVVLSTSGAFLLTDESPSAAYTAMTLPVLIASSLIAPWAGFVVVAALMLLAALLGTLSLSIVIVLVVSVVSYLFADSLDQAHIRSRYQASHDSLTDLPNRSLFTDLLERAVQKANQDEKSVAVLFLDLDNFKVVNDSLGHEIGDKLLVGVGERIGKCLRSEDIVARLGGDEFTVLLPDLDDFSEVLQVAERITATLKQPLTIGAHELRASASVGISLGKTGADSEAILQEADMAMYRAKQAGKSYEVFHYGMQDQAVLRLELETNLGRAVREQEFEVYYQPKVHLDSGRLVGMEALVRWRDPQRGLIMPSEFIPLAEETGLILPIGQRVMEIACHQAKEWEDQYSDFVRLKMCVNLSARQFQAPNLVNEIYRALEQPELPAEFLELEITESTMMGNESRAVRILQDLKGLGVSCTVDDFGTGYSSLSNLKSLPFSSLKIDKSFVDGLGANDTDKAMVRFIVEMAHYLGLAVTVEGIESAQQLTILKEMRCDFGQGYYFSKPLCREEADIFIAANCSG